MKKMIIPILILLLLTGYTPYVEVNDLVIVDMIGLEKVNNKYLLTVNTIKEEKTDNAGTLFCIDGSEHGISGYS